MHLNRALITLCCALVVASCGGARLDQSVPGNAENGRLLLRQYGCVSCHTIPGVAGARGNVGPPLAAIARRVYLAGVIANTPENMVRWIDNPKAIDPLTAMPDMQVPEQQIRDMVAYLYTLR